MGKLRKEPKYKSFLSPEEYESYVSVLQEARLASDNNHVFWDLDDDEKPAREKKALMYVARKTGVDVTIRQVRGSRSLAFYFKKGAPLPGTRLSASECRKRILKCLKRAGVPLKKNRIIKETGVSSSTWNVRIRELIDEGLVKRQGDRRETNYTIAKETG